MVYVLAVFTALANALASILQRMGVEAAPEKHTLRLSLIAYALRRKVWLAGLGMMIAAFLLQASALGVGEMSVVQPILTLELPFLVAILAFWFHRQLTWREWAGSVAAAGGLAGFLTIASPSGGRSVPDIVSWGEVSFSVVATVALITALARVGPPAWRAAAFGAAAAVMFAFTAALIKQMDRDFHPWYGFLLHWHAYAMGASGLVALFLTQNAFHSGPVTASQAALVILDPIASILIGVGLFGDDIDTSGARGPLEALALLVLCAGGVFLSRSPLVQHVRMEEDPEPGDAHGDAVGGLMGDASPGPALGLG